MGGAESLITIADERALDIEGDGVRMLFAFGPPESAASSEERMHRLLAALEPQIVAVRWGEQIHGRLIASLSGAADHPIYGAACVGRCDALMTPDSNTGLVVWTADCVPILLRGNGVVAAVHSGWRGAVGDIASAVVRRFAVEYGVPAGHLRAVLGPAISGPRYEVSREIIAGFRAFGLDEERWRAGNHVDLRGFLAARLEDLGLDPDTITTVGPCTASTPGLASYRRDGLEAGRQWSMVYRTRSSF